MRLLTDYLRRPLGAAARLSCGRQRDPGGAGSRPLSTARVPTEAWGRVGCHSLQTRLASASRACVAGLRRSHGLGARATVCGGSTATGSAGEAGGRARPPVRARPARRPP